MATKRKREIEESSIKQKCARNNGKREVSLKKGSSKSAGFKKTSCSPANKSKTGRITKANKKSDCQKGSPKKKNNVPQNSETKTKSKKSKRLLDYKTKHHIGRRKATESVITYSESGTTFFDLYTDFKTFDLPGVGHYSRASNKRTYEHLSDSKSHQACSPKRFKHDSCSSNKTNSSSLDKENLSQGGKKSGTKKPVGKRKGLEFRQTEGKNDLKGKNERCHKNKKNITASPEVESSPKTNCTKTHSSKKRVSAKFKNLKPRAPCFRREASLNAEAVMNLLYEKESSSQVNTAAGGQVNQTVVIRNVGKCEKVSKKDDAKKSTAQKHSVPSAKNGESPRKDNVSQKVVKKDSKKTSGKNNNYSRVNKKEGNIKKMSKTIQKKPQKCCDSRTPNRFRELKNLLDCENNDLDCSIIKSIKKGFFSKGMKKKIQASDIQLGVWTHKRRMASLNAQAILAASGIQGDVLSRNSCIGDDDDDDDEVINVSDSFKKCETTMKKCGVKRLSNKYPVVVNQKLEMEEDVDILYDNHKEEYEGAARTIPDVFKVTRYFNSGNHVQGTGGHWVDGLGNDEISRNGKEPIRWTNQDLVQDQQQQEAPPISPSHGAIVPVSHVPSPRPEVIKVTPRQALPTPPMSFDGSHLPVSYQHSNNNGIIPSTHCQSFTLNGIGSISLMAYPQRYDSAFRVPGYSSNAYYPHPGCYNESGPVMQSVPDRHGPVVHQPIPVQMPQQDLEIIFHHHNSQHTIKPCCSKTETVTCTVTHTQQINQRNNSQPHQLARTPPMQNLQCPPPVHNFHHSQIPQGAYHPTPTSFPLVSSTGMSPSRIHNIPRQTHQNNLQYPPNSSHSFTTQELPQSPAIQPSRSPYMHQSPQSTFLPSSQSNSMLKSMPKSPKLNSSRKRDDQLTNNCHRRMRLYSREVEESRHCISNVQSHCQEGNQVGVRMRSNLHADSKKLEKYNCVFKETRCEQNSPKERGRTKNDPCLNSSNSERKRPERLSPRLWGGQTKDKCGPSGGLDYHLDGKTKDRQPLVKIHEKVAGKLKDKPSLEKTKAKVDKNVVSKDQNRSAHERLLSQRPKEKVLEQKKPERSKDKGKDKTAEKPKATGDKKSANEKKRFVLRTKEMPKKCERGTNISVRRSSRTKSYESGWQWVGEPVSAPVFSCNDVPPVEHQCYSAICHTDGDVIKVQDCVLLRSGPRKKDLPFVAKISAFFEREGEKMMSLLWYYRPEHTESGRLPHHVPAELFASKHRDENSIACIEDKCHVLTLGRFCRYRAKLKMQEENTHTHLAWQGVVPEAEGVSSEHLPLDADPEVVFLCRQVYDFRQKRILKNPA